MTWRALPGRPYRWALKAYATLIYWLTVAADTEARDAPPLAPNANSAAAGPARYYRHVIQRILTLLSRVKRQPMAWREQYLPEPLPATSSNAF